MTQHRRKFPQTKVKALQNQRKAWSQFQENLILAEEIQGYALLLDTKNVALVDISEHTKEKKNG